MEGKPVAVYSNERVEAGKIEVEVESMMDFIVPLIKHGYQVWVEDDGEGIAMIKYLWADYKNYGGHYFAEVDERGAYVDEYTVENKLRTVIYGNDEEE